MSEELKRCYDCNFGLWGMFQPIPKCSKGLKTFASIDEMKEQTCDEWEREFNCDDCKWWEQYPAKLNFGGCLMQLMNNVPVTAGGKCPHFELDCIEEEAEA